MKKKIIFIFLDGVGMGPSVMSNPFYLSGLPHIEDLTGCKITIENSCFKNNILLKGIDACLGVPGIPQSATGQTTLFTGINAADYLGYHFPAFPDEKLKKIINEHSLFKRVTESGFKATFANAYTPHYFSLVKAGKRQHSVTTLSVYAANLPFRGLDDLACGNAVYWDLTNEFLKIRYDYDVKQITSQRAGENLVQLTAGNDLVVFECFLPDLIGHKRDRASALKFLLDLDQFLFSIISKMNSDTILIVTSDHGNMENLDSAGHTTNPVLLFGVGEGVLAFAKVQSLTEISDLIINNIEGKSDT